MSGLLLDHDRELQDDLPLPGPAAIAAPAAPGRGVAGQRGVDLAQELVDVEGLENHSGEQWRDVVTQGANPLDRGGAEDDGDPGHGRVQL
jgi:hypothetical protein